ncbi:hypothetical protein Q5752_003941 [Cryptotrichosporon argae]
MPDSSVSTPYPSSPVDKAAAPSSSFLSDKAKTTEIDGIRGLLPLEGPGVVSAGRPNPETFPFASITLNLRPPLSPDGPAAEAVTISGCDLDEALQYGPSAGLPALRAWLGAFQGEVHGRAEGDWTTTVGSGSQDVMSKGFKAVLNPGDPILIETPVYAGILPALRDLNAEMIEVEVDDQGLAAKDLERVLATWPEGKKRPRAVYSNPVGCNPSGCSASRERKLEVLAVAKKYDLLIFEDDPYYFLAQHHIPSYFALETQFFPQGGHVVRFDSFSKLLTAGARLGFATGPKDILHAIDVQTAAANLHTSSISQAVIYGLLKHWGTATFLSHAAAVADFYAARRERIEAIAHRHLDGLARWVSPVAGMFLWIDLSPAGIADTYDLVRKEALAKGVLAVPGFAFYPNGRKSTHLRISFSIIDLDEAADLGLSRLAEAIRDRQRASA